jgi:hypothetical protein
MPEASSNRGSTLCSGGCHPESADALDEMLADDASGARIAGRALALHGIRVSDSMSLFTRNSMSCLRRRSRELSSDAPALYCGVRGRRGRLGPLVLWDNFIKEAISSDTS